MEAEDLYNNRFIFNGMNFENLSELEIIKNSNQSAFFSTSDCLVIVPSFLQLNEGIFTHKSGGLNFPAISVIQDEKQLTVFCNCKATHDKLCENQALVLTAIHRNEDYLLFFQKASRNRKTKKVAEQFGLEKEANLEAYFDFEFIYGKLEISPKDKSLIPITTERIREFNSLLSNKLPTETKSIHSEDFSVVFKHHKHSNSLQIDLVTGSKSNNGKLKNPLKFISPLDVIWKFDNADDLKFFAAIQQFQSLNKTESIESEIAALRSIAKNPLGCSFFFHNFEISERVQEKALIPLRIKNFQSLLSLTVRFLDPFYEITGQLEIDGLMYDVEQIEIRFNRFLHLGETFYLTDKIQTLNVLEMLKKRGNKWQIHQSKFEAFKVEILEKLEAKIEIEYTHLPKASKKQIQKEQLDEIKKIIYLVDSENFVDIIPVIRYGEIEVPIRSKKVISLRDDKGKEFVVKRNQAEEIKFTALIYRQHPYFEEQLENEFTYFYLHKKHFLEEDWFLNTFESWQSNNIQIHGFNQLQGNKLNQNKVKIDIKVLSGINWFNAEIQVKYGNQNAALKQLAKSIRNNSNYVKLDDGTTGILHKDWIEKFKRYFNSGEIIDLKNIQIPKINFSTIETIFETEQIDEKVAAELAIYRQRFEDFNSIQEVQVPSSLKATLRSYQKSGLNWLNFLDDFNFGGVLADDMGLGKSIQIIAFILLQREKVNFNVNLLVVPATLLFNWKAEFQKFAPSLKFTIHHGNQRIKKSNKFDQNEVILTSYGTLMSDIHLFKDFVFNYIFLDESQNIRNPETERYKAVKLLQSRNKIAITGTPIENSTFDLFAQFSFACPGLFGNKQYFKDVYLAPVDHFKNDKRTAELQHKIKPFLMRRTKEEVAPELPEKKEIVVFCEMETQQRKMYDQYEKDFREYIENSNKFDLNKNSMYVLKGLTKLRQICDAPVLADELSQGIPSAKLEMLIEQITNKAPTHKILVFSQFVTMLDLIHKELKDRKIQTAYLTGKTNNREAVVREFQENKEVKVFLISLKAGGTGLNLTEADYVYLVDPWWNPAVENQAIDRVHRIGQTKNTLAIRLICPNTIEDKIRILQESKKSISDELITNESGFFKNLSKENLLDLLSDLK
jgi:SNF2 family DNA or RNA helicase